MIKKILFLNFIIVLLSFSCSDSMLDGNDNNLSSPLLPLKTGNYWVYTVGIKDSYKDTTIIMTDTLKVIAENDSGFLIKSATQIVLPDGYYSNGPDGLYSSGELQFKYPGEVGEYCGKMALGDLVSDDGKEPYGTIDRTDFKFTYTDAGGNPQELTDCYYYFLVSFYPTPDIKKSGYTAFKPGVGLVVRDWADIDETVNEFYNPYAALRSYYIQK